jgi:uncharacterized protein
VKIKKVSFLSAGKKMSALILTPDKFMGKLPGLLVLHGWRSEKDRYPERVKDIVENGFIALLIDLPGHGQSEGDINTLVRKDFMNGVYGAYDYLTSLPEVDKDKIGVEGSSFGGYLAILLTKERPTVKWLSLKNPANYPDSGKESPQVVVSDTIDHGIWSEQPMDASKNEAINALNHFKGKILLMQSEKDKIIPLQTFTNYLSAISDKSKLTHSIIKDADHRTSTPKWENEYRRIHTEWFKQMLNMA